MRSRNIVRESPGVSASITIRPTIVRSPRHRGQDRLCRSLRQVEPRSMSGQAFSAGADSRWRAARILELRDGETLKKNDRAAAVLPRSKAGRQSGDDRDGLGRGPPSREAGTSEAEKHRRSGRNSLGRRRATATCALPLLCCGASHRRLNKRRFQRSPSLSSSPKT